MLLDWLPFAAIVVVFFLVWRRRSRVRDIRKKKAWREDSPTWSEGGSSGHISHGSSSRHSASLFGGGASGGAGAAAAWSSSNDSSDSGSDGGSDDSGGSE